MTGPRVAQLHVMPKSVLLIAVALASTTLSGQVSQPNQTDRSTPAPGTSRPAQPPAEPARPAQPSSEPTRPAPPPIEPARNIDDIGRRPAEQPAVASPAAQRPCGTAASAVGAPSGQASPFPGVSASQLPRAGVPADAFVRPGVSAAQLATLLPGARSTPCATPRDVILYPDLGTPARRVPPPGENEP